VGFRGLGFGVWGLGFEFWLGEGRGEVGGGRGEVGGVEGEGGKERKGCVVGLDESKGGMVVGLVDEVEDVREMVDEGSFSGDMDVFLDE